MPPWSGSRPRSPPRVRRWTDRGLYLLDAGLGRVRAHRDDATLLARPAEGVPRPGPRAARPVRRYRRRRPGRLRCTGPEVPPRWSRAWSRPGPARWPRASRRGRPSGHHAAHSGPARLLGCHRPVSIVRRPLPVTHVLLLIGCAGVSISPASGSSTRSSGSAPSSTSAELRSARSWRPSARPPESVVTLFAILFGGEEQGKDLGVGAALGGLVVGTIAYGVAGVVPSAATGAQSARVHLGRPRRGPEVLPDDRCGGPPRPGRLSGKRWLGLVFFAAYGLCGAEMSRDEGLGGLTRLEPLVRPALGPPAPAGHLGSQTLGCARGDLRRPQLFVHQLEWVGPAIGLPSTLVALLLSPVATELPETLNAVIWVRQGKTQNLALSNGRGDDGAVHGPRGIGLLMTLAVTRRCSSPRSPRFGARRVPPGHRPATAHGRSPRAAAGWYAASSSRSSSSPRKADAAAEPGSDQPGDGLPRNRIP